jgi:deoxyribonuclease-4
MNLGAHMSIEGGVHIALQRGISIGCNAVQLFVKNNNRWKSPPLTEEHIKLFGKYAEKFDRKFILAHSGYLINLASPDKTLIRKSIQSMRDEMDRCDQLGIRGLVIHPGSHRGSGESEGIERIASNINRVLYANNSSKTMILLETTAGQGFTIGHKFEHLADIIDRVENKKMMGVCYDTCHTFAAGYDIRTRKQYEQTFEKFDRVIGFDRLELFHLNDSLAQLGTRKDRHTHIGEGKMGLEPFSYLVNDARFSGIPMILETPKGKGLEEDIRNLNTLRNLRNMV